MFPFPLPFFSLKPGLNWDPDRAGHFLRFLQAFGASPDSGTLADTLLAPFRVFLQGRFDNVRFYDGILGPVFLLVPLLFLSEKPAGARFPPDVLAPLPPLLGVLHAAGPLSPAPHAVPMLALAYASRASEKGLADGLRRASPPLQYGNRGEESSRKRRPGTIGGARSRRSYLARQKPVLAFYAEATGTGRGTSSTLST